LHFSKTFHIFANVLSIERIKLPKRIFFRRAARERGPSFHNTAEQISLEEKMKAWIASLPENDKRGVSKSTLSELQEKLHEVLSDVTKVR